MSAASTTPAVPAVLIVMAGGEAESRQLASVLLAVPVARRIALSAAQEGFERVVFVTTAPGIICEVLEGTPGEVRSSAAGLAIADRARIVVLGHDVLPDARWLGALRARELELDRVYCDGDLAATIDTSNASRVLSLLAGSATIETVHAAMVSTFRVGALEPDPRGRIRIVPGERHRETENWLLGQLVKDSESFMSRHVERRISLAISRRLVSGPVSPTGMTLFSIVVGLAGAPFFLSPEPVYQTMGALLFLAHSVLDGCDGELARLRFQQSRLGGLLDFWGDNVVHATIFFFMGVGWSQARGESWPLLIGATASAATLATAWVVYVLTMRERSGRAGPMFTSVVRSRESVAARVLDALGKRDFIYLVLAFAMLGKASWFLFAAAIGTPIFLLALLGLAGRDGSAVPSSR